MVHVQCSLVNISVKVCRTLIKHCPAVLYDSVKRALVTFASEEEAQTAFDKYLAKPAGKFVLKKYHLNHSSKYKYASVCVCVHVHNFLYRVPLLMCDSADSGSDAVLRLALTRVTCGVALRSCDDVTLCVLTVLLDQSSRQLVLDNVPQSVDEARVSKLMPQATHINMQDLYSHRCLLYCAD